MTRNRKTSATLKPTVSAAADAATDAGTGVGSAATPAYERARAAMPITHERDRDMNAMRALSERMMQAAPNPAAFDSHAQWLGKRQYSADEGELFNEAHPMKGMLVRVAAANAMAEAPEQRDSWATAFYELMRQKKFCPGGRILAGAGTVHGNQLNCLQGDTIVETRGGQRLIRDLHGDVEILSQDGAYRMATFRSFGEQELLRVTFANGETIEATPGHDWVHGGKEKGSYPRVKTTELLGKFVPVIATGRRPERNEDFVAGLQHGIVYGDGSKNTGSNTHHVSLFGEKRQLAEHLSGSTTRDVMYGGREQTRVTGMRGELKALPDDLTSDSYWYGFFTGLMATDGNVDDRGSSALFSSELSELQALAQQLHRFGVKHASIKAMTPSAGRYGPRPCYVMRLLKQTMQPRDFIRDDQRANFEASLLGKPKNASLQVVAVEPTGRSEEVFCCTEMETHTMVIQGGFLTGQCFVQAATIAEPGSLDGIMEVAAKLALVTKVGGGNGVNLDPITGDAQRHDLGMVGVAYMDASHPDAEDFMLGLMRPPTRPDSDKEITALRNWRRVLYGEASEAQRVTARANGVGYAHRAPADTQQVPDDMGGIIDAARQVTITALAGQVPRIDLSQMRPEGTPIRGSGGTSSGPVSFLVEIFDNFLQWANHGAERSGPVHTLRYIFSPVLRVVRQGGSRRGAGMATISAANPHVLDFLTSKDLDREAGEGDISTFNISVLIGDDFMRQIREGESLTYHQPTLPRGKFHLPGEQAAEGSVELPAPDESGSVTIPAAWLWDQIADHAWRTGEPGLIFNDRVNQYSAVSVLGGRYVMKATNPCGEIPLTAGEPCDLGAINLAAYVHGGVFDRETFKADVRTCVRFLDNVLEVNRFALEDNRVASQDLRRLGLGVMGLADALILMGLRYDSDAGRDAIDSIIVTLRDEAVAASEELGRERGVYPIYAQHADVIKHAPRRNVSLLTVAPTGTTSMLFGASSGVEPVFSVFIWRKIGSEYVTLLHPLFIQMMEDWAGNNPNGLNTFPGEYLTDGGDLDWDAMTEALGNNHGTLQGLDWVPDEIREVFVCAHDISPLDHVRMQGTVQRAFDGGGLLAASAISKTINLPNSATVADIQQAYQEAYDTGCKGITVYRDGSRSMQVISTSKGKAASSPEVQADAQELSALRSALAEEGEWFARLGDGGRITLERFDPQMVVDAAEQRRSATFRRPPMLEAISYQVRTFSMSDQEKKTYLVNVGHAGDRVLEVQVLGGRAGDEANADAEALGRVVSIALQNGVSPGPIIHTLRHINGGMSGSMQGRLISSKGDMIAVALQDVVDRLEGSGKQGANWHAPQDGTPADQADHAQPETTPSAQVARIPGASKCPKCSNETLVREEGCHTCRSCGYSKCG